MLFKKRHTKKILLILLLAPVMCLSQNKLIEEYYDNGQIKRTGTHKKSSRNKTIEVKHGLWEYYYEDGQLLQRSEWRDGVYDGIFESYYKNGQRRELSISKTGTLLCQIHYYENGQLERTIVYDDKKRKAIIRCWDKNGEEIEKCFLSENEILW